MGRDFTCKRTNVSKIWMSEDTNLTESKEQYSVSSGEEKSFFRH